MEKGKEILSKQTQVTSDLAPLFAKPDSDNPLELQNQYFFQNGSPEES